MTTELATAPPANPMIVARGDDLHVSATTPEEMSQANAALIQWCVLKIAAIKGEAEELTKSAIHAQERGWKSSTLFKHAALAEKRVAFYEKVKGALDAGFYIVPNFPVVIFAIRTDKDKPQKFFRADWRESYQSGAPGWNLTQAAGKLPAGDGEYQNPSPIVSEQQTGYDAEKKRTLWTSEATDWQEMEFPLSMSKPVIMEATSRAMALKIFDEFGILEQGKSGDPLIVGRLIDPRPAPRLFPRHMTFIVAWHLDTKTI